MKLLRHLAEISGSLLKTLQTHSFMNSDSIEKSKYQNNNKKSFSKGAYINQNKTEEDDANSYEQQKWHHITDTRSVQRVTNIFYCHLNECMSSSVHE